MLARRFFTFSLVLLGFGLMAQPIPTALSDLLQEIRSLEKETRVLYLAAHPDDENTRLISWLTHGAGARTAYLSLTRGDGGQNLIGPELGPGLGYIRTQELLEARKIDGGTQFFSRAVDFGYSKSAEETFRFWGKEEVLSDVVYVIRKFRPHIIITRFPPDSRGGHGHHTASAILAEEAFDLSNDPTAFPEQLGSVDLWQAEMLYWNASSWWDKTLPERAKTEDHIVEIDVGGYDAIMGRSCNELASLSRSMHKSQGFGIPMARGEMKEYLEFRKGENAFSERLFPKPQNDIDLPSKAEMAAYFLVQGRRDLAIAELYGLREGLRIETRERVDRIIAGILGMYVEVNAPNWFASVGSSVEVELQCLLRLDYPVKVKRISWNDEEELLNAPLQRDQAFKRKHILTLERSSNPYWLQKPFDALFDVPDSLIGMPQNPIAPFVEVELEYADKTFTLRSPVQYKWSDRVEGELQRPFVSAPEVTVNFAESSLVTSGQAVELRLLVRAWTDNYHDNLRLELPEGWKVKPEFIPVDIAKAGEEQTIQMTLYPPAQPSQGQIRPILGNASGIIRSHLEIDYPHIRKEVLFLPSVLKVANARIVIDPGVVGYIEGAGDAVPEALRSMGFEVEMLDETAIQDGELDRYLAIVAGIRAYNTNEWLPRVQDKLMKYVEEGGNYIVQYNTRSRDLKLDSFGPYPMKLSRNRVSEEDAAVRIVDPTNDVFLRPNPISQNDFSGWVQERGLYFADEESLDPAYQVLLSWHDKDEPPRLGGLIMAHHGDGCFMYTGISFFRQLPAAVPGAYRLLANMICYEP